VRRGERGVALLEVLAAVVILGIAGLALVQLVAGGTRAVTLARERERELADEDRLLAAYTLLRREDLDLRLGDREVEAYVVNVQRPEQSLYRIALRRMEAVTVEALVTVVYRPEARDAP
jgi:type II secretory pathway pseudopilin PulG